MKIICKEDYFNMKKAKRDITLQRSVEIPDEMWEWLKQEADENETSRAGLIRKLVAAAMKKKAKEE